MKDIVPILKRAAIQWQKDKMTMRAAALSYYTVFSIAPLLVVLISLVGFFFHSGAEQQILGEIGGMMGRDAGRTLQEAIRSASDQKAGAIASAIGIVTLLLGASGVFTQFKEALNAVWHVEPKPNQGIWHTIRTQFLSFSMLLVIGFIIMVSLMSSTGLGAVSTFMKGVLTVPPIILQSLNLVLSFALTTVLFALMFKILPDIRSPWSITWRAAILTSILFVIGKELISFYIVHTSVGSVFGAAGSLAVILVWVYYAAQIVFFGAEFMKAESRVYNIEVLPSSDARFQEVSVKQEKKSFIAQLIGYTIAGLLMQTGKPRRRGWF